MYIGAQLGRGPRDGLMTGLHRRTGLSLRLVRTGLEVAVVLVGLLLGGVAGVGTVLYALAIGPLAQRCCRSGPSAQPVRRLGRSGRGRAAVSAWWRSGRRRRRRPSPRRR